jgi:hypothetical protein
MPDNSYEGEPRQQLSTFIGWDPQVMMRAFASVMGTAPQPNGSAGIASNGGPYASWLEINQHWTIFLMRRFQKDLALMQKLATCGDPAFLGEAYTEFFKTAQADYQNEILEMTRFGSKTVDAVPTSLQSGEAGHPIDKVVASAS